MIIYHQADERPSWVATVTVNGTGEDMTSGYTYQVKVATSPTATAALTKTTGITGASGGVVTVAWATDELDLEPGFYNVQLKATRTSDSAEWTIEDTLKILPRL